MPNRTIYVADTDLPTFEKAQQLAGGNLSATIAQALRRFVEAEEASAGGYEEITVALGKGRPYVKKQFRGRLLARRHTALRNKARTLTLVVYQTVHGRFALYTKNAPNWDWSGRVNQKSQKQPVAQDSEEDWGWSASGWGEASEVSERTLDVFEELESLKEAIPGEMYESIVRYLQQGDETEFLDI